MLDENSQGKPSNEQTFLGFVANFWPDGEEIADEHPVGRAIRLVKTELASVESRNQLNHYLEAFNVSISIQVASIIILLLKLLNQHSISSVSWFRCFGLRECMCVCVYLLGSGVDVVPVRRLPVRLPFCVSVDVCVCVCPRFLPNWSAAT